MIWHATVGKIRYPRDKVWYVESLLLVTLWEVSFNGFRWVFTNAVIITPPDSSPLHYRMTIQTSKGDVPITVSPSGNGRGCLIVLYDGWVTGCIVQTYSRIPEGLQATYGSCFSPTCSAMSGNEVFSAPVRLVWSNWSEKNSRRNFSQAECSLLMNCWGKFHLVILLCQTHVFLFVCLYFLRFFHLYFCPHICYLHFLFSHNFISGELLR